MLGARRILFFSARWGEWQVELNCPTELALQWPRSFHQAYIFIRPTPAVVPEIPCIEIGTLRKTARPISPPDRGGSLSVTNPILSPMGQARIVAMPRRSSRLQTADLHAIGCLPPAANGALLADELPPSAMAGSTSALDGFQDGRKRRLSYSSRSASSSHNLHQPAPNRQLLKRAKIEAGLEAPDAGAGSQDLPQIQPGQYRRRVKQEAGLEAPQVGLTNQDLRPRQLGQDQRRVKREHGLEAPELGLGSQDLPPIQPGQYQRRVKREPGLEAPELGLGSQDLPPIQPGQYQRRVKREPGPEASELGLGSQDLPQIQPGQHQRRVKREPGPEASKGDGPIRVKEEPVDGQDAGIPVKGEPLAGDLPIRVKEEAAKTTASSRPRSAASRPASVRGPAVRKVESEPSGEEEGRVEGRGKQTRGASRGKEPGAREDEAEEATPGEHKPILLALPAGSASKADGPTDKLDWDATGEGGPQRPSAGVEGARIGRIPSSARKKGDRAQRKGSSAVAGRLTKVETADGEVVALKTGNGVVAYVGPFPNHPRPYPRECAEVRDRLATLHGAVHRSEYRACPSLLPGEFPEASQIKGEEETDLNHGEGKGKLDNPLLLNEAPASDPMGDKSMKREADRDETPVDAEGPSANQPVMVVSGSRNLTLPSSVTRNGMPGVVGEGVATDIVPRNMGSPTGEPLSVLDSLIRTILSQNTTDTNSRRAFASLKASFPTWEEVYAAEPKKVEDAIRSGGLAEIKGRRIREILGTLQAERGRLDLEYLRGLTNEEIKTELGRFKGVGPKTVACVLMFHLEREEFPVDTHVFRISKMLGWVPESADRERTYLHLNQRVPDGVKYSLHCLMVTHGKRCPRCAKGKAQKASDGPCPLVNWSREYIEYKGHDRLGDEMESSRALAIEN